RAVRPPVDGGPDLPPDGRAGGGGRRRAAAPRGLRAGGAERIRAARRAPRAVVLAAPQILGSLNMRSGNETPPFPEPEPATAVLSAHAVEGLRVAATLGHCVPGLQVLL